MTIAVQRNQIAAYLRAFDFRKLFIEELGWDHYRGSLSIEIKGGATFTLGGVAEKKGVVVLVCCPDANGGIPNYATRKLIEDQVVKSVREHLIIFTDEHQNQQFWLWTKREQGQRPQYRGEWFFKEQSGERLVQKLQQIEIPLESEEDLRLLDVTTRLGAGFDVERVTRGFYDRFQTEHKGFMQAITGIKNDEMRRWYASLMLNRLMFTYFIQKKGFLDDDIDYLPHRLERVQELGRNKFHSFYRGFLLHLFHEGLGKPLAARQLDPELARLIGNVPYLNGGLFEVHQIESSNPDIAIPDSAFERIFAFFDDYDWYLDDRPLRNDREINPDVLGYIFEKYINQKQMGAYYTKEDITSYIARNTILPFIYDRAYEQCKVAFDPGGEVWRLLQDDPDRYIYHALRYGVDEPLPPEIAAGITDVANRSGWTRPAPEPYALPTETWREHIARRQRCLQLRERLANGEVTRANDLITYNLDIERLARDVIERCEGPEVLRAFWQAITTVTVLDPTCGSGAFLFAALNILRPLYEACLDRMQAFVADFDRLEEQQKGLDFREVLMQIAKHPKREYFVLKSIIIGNLYGVDIMAEACEIAKLRLFLTLVAQVDDVAKLEPLPDIDFNIRAGNTLVGFSTFAEVNAAVANRLQLQSEQEQLRADILTLSRKFDEYRQQQMVESSSELRILKNEILAKSDELEHKLDAYLAFIASEHGAGPTHQPNEKQYTSEFDAWRTLHSPFHWLLEFFGIVHNQRGFDVIIGNPPYVSTKGIEYDLSLHGSNDFADLYAYVLMRCVQLSASQARIGMIVPLSLMFSEDFGVLRKELCAAGTAWLSSFDNIPAALFAGVSQRCTIWLAARNHEQHVYVSSMYRWRSDFRSALVQTISYADVNVREVETRGIPRVASPIQMNLINSVGSQANWRTIRFAPKDRTAHVSLTFSQTARNFVSVYLEPPPTLDDKSLRAIAGSDGGAIRLRGQSEATAALACLAGDTFFMYWLARADGFHMTSWVISDFLLVLNALSPSAFESLSTLGRLIHERRFEALVFKRNAGKYVGNFNYRHLTPLTRRADLVLLADLGFDTNQAIDLMESVQRVLAINEHAGEKAIPTQVKDLFPPAAVDVASVERDLSAIDQCVLDRFVLGANQLAALLSGAGASLSED